MKNSFELRHQRLIAEFLPNKLFELWSGMKNSQNLHNASQLEDNDIIYVPHTEVGKFVNDILDGVSTNIVVVSWDSID